MKKTITILLVFLSFSLFGQSLSKVDSLLNAAQQETEQFGASNDNGLGLKIGVGASILALLVIVGIGIFRTKQVEKTSKIAKNEAHRFKTIFNSVIDAMIVMGTDRKIIEINNSTLEMFGYSAEELIGHNVKILMPEPYHTEHDGYVKAHIDTGIKKVIGSGRQVMAKRKDNSVFPADLAVTKMELDGELYFIGLLTDITERVESLNKIQNRNAQMEIISFLVRHDMVGGLNYSLRGLSSLKRRMSEEDIKKFKIGGAVTLLTNGLTQQEEILEGVTDWTNIIKNDGEELHREEFDADEVIRTWVERQYFKDDVEVEEMELLTANKSLFNTAVTNLIKNAIVHNDKPVKKITVFRDKNTIKVKDNGNGFDVSQFEKYCQPFQRASGNQGSGLGLAIVKGVCDVHGWALKAESEIGKGSTIILLLNKK